MLKKALLMLLIRQDLRILKIMK